jgi:hypothetical protein
MTLDANLKDGATDQKYQKGKYIVFKNVPNLTRQIQAARRKP